MWYLNQMEMKLTKQRLAKNGGYRHSLASWVMLALAWVAVFSVFMLANPWSV